MPAGMPWMGVRTGLDGGSTMGRIPTFIDAGKHSNALRVPPEQEQSSCIITEMTDVSNLGGPNGGGQYDGALASTSAGTCGAPPGGEEKAAREKKRNQPPPEARYWTWGSTQASTASLVCFPLLAVFGMWYSLRAYKLFKAGEYYKSWKMKKLAWSFTIASLVTGILMWLTIVSVFWSY